MPDQREYRIDIDPRILELLGPHLYTNIYYVLAELVANSYDANASNVYIIQKDDQIIVEDDGTGMSYKAGDIERYLKVAAETRTTEADSVTADGRRRKIGRKGVGKLAALSVSERVLVMTRKRDEVSGFVLSRHVGESHLLEPIDPARVKFEYVSGDGTSVVMTDPQYGLHTTASAIKNNLLKIFPLVNEEFKIHVITDGASLVIDSFDKQMIQHLCALLVLGDEFHHLAVHFDSQLERKDEVEEKLLQKRGPISEDLQLRNRAGVIKPYKIEIKGWLGAYSTTKGRKADRTDFPDNFISLLANAKLGEYNILPTVGRNRLAEVYVVGQLHVDLLEETDLPDMSLSNRQGYRTDDPRYEFVIRKVSDELLPKIIGMREAYADHLKKLRNEGKIQRQKAEEEELRGKVEEYKTSSSAAAAKRISEKVKPVEESAIQEIIKSQLNDALPMLGLKSRVDQQKKKILICHTGSDKDLADIVYSMLIFNGFDDEDLIYTSCDNEGARIPEETGVFDYLRDFFVNSYSTNKIIVLYVTSEEMARSWGAVTEVGAGWITKMDHKIFNVKGHRPQRPLNVDVQWQTSVKKDGRILMDPIEFDKFIVKVRSVCDKLGLNPKSKEANERELRRYVTVT